MLIQVGLTAAFAQDPSAGTAWDPCAGAPAGSQCDERFAHRAAPIRISAPPPRTAPVVAPRQAADCALTVAELETVRDEITYLRKLQGEAIGVAAIGPGCEAGLDQALRGGPFLGVYRASVPQTVDDPCVGVLHAAPGGWAIEPMGACVNDSVPQVDTSVVSAETATPSRVATLGAWLPYGGTFRLNQDLDDGWSAMVDVAWHPPRLWDVSYDTKYLGPDSARTSSFRWLFGLDVSNGPLEGGYLGARAGFEAATPAHQMKPNEGILMAVLGHRWIDPDRSVLQVGGGVQAAFPIGAKDGPVVITPAAELRIGVASQK